jgi:hypothetical protein
VEWVNLAQINPQHMKFRIYIALTFTEFCDKVYVLELEVGLGHDLDGRGILIHFLAGIRDFYLNITHSCSGTQQASYTVVTGDKAGGASSWPLISV